MANPIAMHPIGIVHSPYKEAKGTPIQGVFSDKTEAWVELDDQCTPGLKDLDGFSHAILLYHFFCPTKNKSWADRISKKRNMASLPSEARIGRITSGFPS